MARGILSVMLMLSVACSYLLPATWRSFRADPDDAAPSITRALAARQLQIAKVDTNRIITDYVFTSDGVDRVRERYIIRWERSASENTLTVYVRHETQDQTSVDGRPAWSQTTHDVDKEATLLDAITVELERQRRPLPSTS